MSSTAIEKIIKKAYKLAGISDENYCVHTLRHTDTKANNIDNLSSLGKLLSNNFVQTQQKNNLKAI